MPPHSFFRNLDPNWRCYLIKYFIYKLIFLSNVMLVLYEGKNEWMIYLYNWPFNITCICMATCTVGPMAFVCNKISIYLYTVHIIVSNVIKLTQDDTCTALRIIKLNKFPVPVRLRLIFQFTYVQYCIDILDKYFITYKGHRPNSTGCHTYKVKRSIVQIDHSFILSFIQNLYHIWEEN